jgi:carboxymethylenebutenolidase
MLPNLYYRQGVMEIGSIAFGDEAHPSRKRMFELAGSVNIPGVMDDVAGLIAFADHDPAARRDRWGAVGYCLSGRFAIMCPVTYPDRFAAAASIYGTHWMTDKPTSPHLQIQTTAAEYYFACAEFDHWVPVAMVEALKQQLAASPAKAEVELYPDAEHGFAFWQRPAYDREAAERHWERLFSLFDRTLRAPAP